MEQENVYLAALTKTLTAAGVTNDRAVQAVAAQIFEDKIPLERVREYLTGMRETRPHWFTAPEVEPQEELVVHAAVASEWFLANLERLAGPATPAAKVELPPEKAPAQLRESSATFHRDFARFAKQIADGSCTVVP